MEKDLRGIEPVTFNVIGWHFNQLSYLVRYLSVLTIQYTYKYIQIHWKMEKNPSGIEPMTLDFLERCSIQLS